MPFALTAIGLLLIVSAVRNTTSQLADAIKHDFSGNNNFFYWIAGIGAVGALGYIPEMRTFSRIFLALIIVVLALHNGGFFSQFQAALASIQAPAQSATDPSTGVTSPDGSTSGAQTAAPGTTSAAPSETGSSIGDMIYNGMGLPHVPDFSTLGGLSQLPSFIGGF